MSLNIFNGIRRDHILAAIQEIDRDGIRKGRHSTTYDLVFNNKKYPPKYVLSLAAQHATGKELAPNEFEGGAGTPAFQFLEKMDFQVVPKTASISFWWVNHKQTGKIEVNEGYIWSPKKNKNGSTNQTYDNLTRTAVGDIIFSYAGGKIPAVGKITVPAVMKDRPPEFGTTGHQWDEKGWLVAVQWQKILHPLIPKEHLDKIVPLLPDKHSPIQKNGNGNQGVYLAWIKNELGNELLSLIERTNSGTKDVIDDIELALQEEAEEIEIQESEIPDTEKKQLIKARIGQGTFRDNVKGIESKCRITGITDDRFLIASHIKPWRSSSNIERLDGHNGLLLSPHIDRLFDKGWISFSNDGILLISKHKIDHILTRWFIESNVSVGTFTNKQKTYLEYHRTNVFKQ